MALGFCFVKPHTMVFLFFDNRPDYFWTNKETAVYVELRSLGLDYVLEVMIIKDGVAKKTYRVLNNDFEREGEMVREAIRTFDHESKVLFNQ